jgi:hypothetical protein
VIIGVVVFIWLGPARLVEGTDRVETRFTFLRSSTSIDQGVLGQFLLVIILGEIRFLIKIE